MKKTSIGLALISIVAVAACQKEDPNAGAGEVANITISLNELNAAGKGDTVSLLVSLGDDATSWEAVSSESWCTLSATSGDGLGKDGSGNIVEVYVAENPTIDEGRTATITFTVDGKKAKKIVPVTQDIPQALVEVRDLATPIVFAGAGETRPMSIHCNFEWTASSAESWCNITSSLSGVGNETLQITCEPNPTKEYRKSMITIKAGRLEAKKNIYQQPNEPIPTEATVWKILWAICPTIDAVANDIHYKTAMTAEDIQLVKEKADLYKNFVESHTHGKLKLQVDIYVATDTVKKLDVFGTGIYGCQLPPKDWEIVDPNKNYDCQIMTADYTGIPTAGWRGVTYFEYGNYSIVPFQHSTRSSWYYEAKTSFDTLYQTNLYVHEWCHQLETHFPSVSSSMNMPTLHDAGGAQYSMENIGLGGEFGLAKWYADFLSGDITIFPNANNPYRGAYPGWWQYTPRSINKYQGWSPWNN